MKPEQQTPSDNSSYEFILNTEEPPKKPFASRINTNRLILLLLIFFVGVGVLAVSIADMRARAADAHIKRLTNIAQQQTEIVRVAALGVESAEQDETKERAQAIQDSVQSSLDQTKQLLEARGALSEKEVEKLSDLQNDSTDEQLAAATESGDYDKTFEGIIDGQLLEYQQALLAAMDAGNDDEQVTLSIAYDDANTILGLVDEE